MGSSAYATVRETHTAVVFLVGDRAYKLRKPVDLGFLDFRERATREAVCHREIALNRRLAPDVYLGVADVRGPDGTVCDHVVVMRRMPADRRLSTLVRAGVPIDDELRRVARMVAAFHATADRGPHISAEGSRDAILQRWDASFAQLHPFHGTVLDAGLAAEIELLVQAFLAGRAALFDDRIAAGRVVDGHADLLADDIFCLTDGPRALDCLEFDDRLRWVDALDDAAFLAMDLEHLGAGRLAEHFLDWYAEFAADPAPAALRHHYIAYRAFVRAKVACLRHQQGDGPAGAEAARLAELTARHLRVGAVRLVLVGGPPGTGKSTLAAQLADRLGAVLLRSDHVRKELAGLVPAQRTAAAYRTGIYDSQWTQRTYDELLKRSRGLLERGETVVLDASWTTAAQRAAARRVAADTATAITELRCEVPPHVIEDRLTRRAAGASDADAAVAAAITADTDPWPQAQAIRTDVALEVSARHGLEAVWHHRAPATFG